MTHANLFPSPAWPTVPVKGEAASVAKGTRIGKLVSALLHTCLSPRRDARPGPLSDYALTIHLNKIFFPERKITA